MHARWDTGRKAVALTTAALIAVVPNVGSTLQAADDAGIHAFFAAESSRAAPRGEPLPVTRSLPVPFTRPAPPLAAREVASRRLPPREVAERRIPIAVAMRIPPSARTRFASLPGTGDSSKARKPRVESDQPADHRRATKPASQLGTSDPVAALLQDKTLRAGDIVMLPDGPKVFQGDEGRSSHKWSSFESVETSRLLPKPTRKMILALAKPAANPSRESAAYLPQTSAAETGEQQQVRADLIRVVYP